MCATRVVVKSKSAEDWLAVLGNTAADGKTQKADPSEGDQDEHEQERAERKPKAKSNASGSASASKASSAPSSRRKVYPSQQPGVLPALRPSGPSSQLVVVVGGGGGEWDRIVDVEVVGQTLANNDVDADLQVGALRRP